jgi:lipopolysaccharide transport system ATP-binding protein
MMLYNQEGSCVFATTSVGESNWHGQPFPYGLFRSVCYIPKNLLNDGLYRVVLLIVQDTTHILYSYQDVITFEVQDTLAGRGDWYGKWPGIVRPQLEWQTDYLHDQVQEAISK